VTCDFSLGGGDNLAVSKVAPKTPGTTAQSPEAQFVTLTQPVKIKIPYGEAVLPRGLKLAILSRDAESVTVSYLDQRQVIPISATDLR
jgi:hypothetical protein